MTKEKTNTLWDNFYSKMSPRSASLYDTEMTVVMLAVAQVLEEILGTDYPGLIFGIPYIQKDEYIFKEIETTHLVLKNTTTNEEAVCNTISFSPDFYATNIIEAAQNQIGVVALDSTAHLNQYVTAIKDSDLIQTLANWTFLTTFYDKVSFTKQELLDIFEKMPYLYFDKAEFQTLEEHFPDLFPKNNEVADDD